MDYLTIVTTVLASVALLIVVAVQWSYRKEIIAAQRDICRFPLFAIRRDLVDLVASGKMQENEEPWQDLYVVVNKLLDMRRSRDLFRTVIGIIKYSEALEASEKMQHEAKESKRAFEEAVERVPEFKVILHRMWRAYVHLVTKHTRARHWCLVYFLKLTLSVARLILWCRVGKSAALTFEREAMPEDLVRIKHAVGVA